MQAGLVSLKSLIYIFIMEEAVEDALYMTILQEMDRFFYAKTPDPNMPEWRDQRVKQRHLFRTEETSIAPAGGILGTRWKETVSLKHSSSTHAAHATHASTHTGWRALLFRRFSDGDFSCA